MVLIAGWLSHCIRTYTASENATQTPRHRLTKKYDAVKRILLAIFVSIGKFS